MVGVSGGKLEPAPNASAAFFSSLVASWPRAPAASVMHFADFLSFRGRDMQQYQRSLPAGEEGEHLWFAGLARAAPETQLCMAAAHQVLLSLEFSAVTNARINGDGGLDTPSIVLPSILAGLVGLGWSKDNLRTAARCYVPALFPNGSVMWECDAKNANEYVNGAFEMQLQQTALAAASLGPVGLADQLSARPDDPAAAITSNLALVLATCSRTGDLLQPSYPATPVERMVVEAGGFGDCFDSEHRPYTFGCGTNVLATYTAVPTATTGGVAVFYLAIAFAYGRGALATSVTLFESDLAPMVDAAALPSPLLDDVPAGAFRGNGTAFAPDAAGPGHVTWLSRNFTIPGCEGVSGLAAWQGAVEVPLPEGNEDGATLVGVAPLWPGGVALLGEAAKAVAISTFRFASVASGGTGRLDVALRGAPGEEVELLFSAGAAAPVCAARTATIGTNGTAFVSFP